MKIEQVVVTAATEESFSTECQRYLNDGWKVIPGTVAISTSISAVTVGRAENMGCQKYSSHSFVAFFER